MNAVEKKGPCLVFAGAGTGKTYTIVEKVKHFVEKGIYQPEKIVCITFSNEAANNLTLRITKSLNDLGIKNPDVIIRTFHGFSADLLRKYGDRIGISKEFKILDPEQAMVLLHRNLKVPALNCDKYISTIGTAKDLGINLEDFQLYLREKLKEYPENIEKHLENLNFDFQTIHLRRNYEDRKPTLERIKKIRKIIELKKFINIWNAYEKVKQKSNYQDYSDLNRNALILLEKFPEIAKEYEYIIVDEFQDTNKLQLDFLIKLAHERNITVVGDINQSIYRFRGAYKENISIFKNAFQINENDIFTLSMSYRSSNKILKIAHKLIQNNYQNKEECFFVENIHGKEGKEISITKLKNTREEARKIVEIVNSLKESLPLEEICIMFRAHQHSRIIKRELEKAKIPYSSVAKSSLLKQKSVKIAYDYLTILNKLKKKETGGETAWWSLVYNLDFSHEDLIKIGKEIKKFSKSGRKTSEEQKEQPTQPLSVYLFTNMESLGLSSSGKLASRILIEKIKLLLQCMDKPVSELIQETIKVSQAAGETREKDGKEAQANLQKFIDIAKTHEELYDSDLSNFLYYLDILQTLNIEIDAARLEEKGVRLMTSHSTKGLEYGAVILTNFSQGRFPIERYIGNPLIPTELLPEVKNEIKGLSEEERDNFIINYEKHNQLLEERRLCYVSFTRAKDNLFITFADEYNGKKFSPSQFLDEIGYKSNQDIIFEIDNEEKYIEDKTEVKMDLNKALNEDNIEFALSLIVKEEKKEQNRALSPSALLLFDDCQKEFEYKYVYNMPERKTPSWEAMRLGSFIHMIFEKGVNSNLKSINEFLQLSKELVMEEEWESINLDEAETLIKVFFERNKDKYNEKSKTEQYLPLNLSGISFLGYADRIDFTPKGAEIIDYKTGKTNVGEKDRNWQLGFYALAAKDKYGKVNKVVLDMLKQERPIEFVIDDLGNAHCVSSKFISGFNIYDVQKELIDTAKKVQEAYKHGFKPCPIEKNCEFCNEYIYNL